MFKIDFEKCTGCGNCEDCCPCGAIRPDEKDPQCEKRMIDPDLCAECGACQDECPFAAIEEVQE